MLRLDLCDDLHVLLDAGAAQGFEASIVFQIGNEAYHWTKAGVEVTVGRGSPEKPDLIMAAPDASIIAAAIYGGAPIETVLVQSLPDWNDSSPLANRSFALQLGSVDPPAAAAARARRHRCSNLRSPLRSARSRRGLSRLEASR